MGRSRRTHSRAFIAFLVILITLGSVFQFHRLRKANASPLKADAAAMPLPDAAKPQAASVAAMPAAPVVPQSPLQNVAAMVSQTPASVVGASNRPADSLTPAIWNAPKPAAPVTPLVTNTSVNPASAIPAAPTPATPVSTPAAHAANTEVATVSAHPLIDAKAKADSGDLISARKTLNDALLAGNLSATDADSVKKQIAQINQTLVFSPKHFANDPYGGVYSVRPGQKLANIANEHDISWQLLLRLNNMSDPRKLRAGQALKVVKGPFHVVVSKSLFTMDVYLGSPGEPGSMYITTYMVGLGRDDSTPTGTWMIKDKVTHPTYYSPRGEGVISSDDPKNPLGPFWLGLAGTDGHAVGKASYGIHGTIEPDSIGKMASMGCIRMHNEDVALVYELLVEGKSTVIVKD